MKRKVTIVLAVGCALALPAFSFAKEHEEKNLKTADVPAAVQKAAEKEATGGKILRWEMEGKNYEAVVEKNGKQWGIAIDANGKVLSKHDESKEKNEKSEKH